MSNYFGNNLITRQSNICSNLGIQKPLDNCAFLDDPLEPCQTCATSHARLDPIHPTFPTSHLGRSLGRTQLPGRFRTSVWQFRKGAVLHLVGSRCQDVHLCKLRNTSTNQARCRLGTFQNLATIRGRSL